MTEKARAEEILLHIQGTRDIALAEIGIESRGSRVPATQRCSRTRRRPNPVDRR